MSYDTPLSIILPAKNEGDNLDQLLPRLRQAYPESEIIVVDDGSLDNTREVCIKHNAKIITHSYSLGNGAAVKSGARAARGEILVFMDADGQHSPEDIHKLLEKLDSGYDMVVGARSNETHASLWRRWANNFYNSLASAIVGQPIADLTCGFRAVRARKFREFLYLLPNGFSYPTTITMAFFRAGYPVAYVPIQARERVGKSHIRPLQDGLRFLLIIFRVGTLYSPLKIFLPISVSLFLLASAYYGYTYTTEGRFTNMSALLYMTSLLVFLIGLVSEQITSLVYQRGSGE